MPTIKDHSTGTSSKKAKRPSPTGMPVINPDAAGADIGATSVYVAVPPDRDEQPVRRFSTFTEDLQRLGQWLKECGVRSVAMEATGVFWIPVVQVLEPMGFEVILVNADSLKHVAGRKTDVSDCQWLQLLHSVGLLRACFRPPDVVTVLRSINRQRESLVAQAAAQIQGMQKALTQMNLHLHHVLSDLAGKSGMAIIDAILAGHRDPHKLAALRDPRVKAREETVVAALTGDWRREHLFALRQARETYDHYHRLIAECDAEIEAWLTEHNAGVVPPEAPLPPAANSRKARKNQITLPSLDLRQEYYRIHGTDLTEVPGFGLQTIHSLFAELGPNLRGSFAAGNNFTSWLGVSPDPRISGGKVLRRRTRHVPHRVARIFRLAAQSLHHSDSPLGVFHRRMKAKLGPAQAITATAHKLARIYYHLVTTQTAYDETVFAKAQEDYERRRLQRIRRDAANLGFDLVPTPGVS